MTLAEHRPPCYDVAVVGAGIAGLFTALCAAGEGRVALISPGRLPPSSSSWLAQGGVAAALDPDDSPELHGDDTLRAGRELCRPSAVRILTEEAPARIVDLVELGVDFDEGLGLEGGHSRRRIVHAGGAATGERALRTLAERVAVHPSIDLLEGHRARAVWLSGDRCAGVVTETAWLAARATVLATGGMAALWERTTNPPSAIGQGALIAYQAGAALADLEFVQFHPTVLADNGLLLSEALRGEGAVLLDRTGQRFTDELGPRDVVARAIEERGTALLDLRSIDRGRFPALMAKIQGAGYDPASEPIPVAPAAHYTMGGIVTDIQGRTDVPSLYAVGECACTGVHGANRLASNSLLECLVFSRRAALAALCEPELAGVSAPRGAAPAPPPPPFPVLPSVTASLRRGLWQHAGLVRDARGLEALARAPHPLARLIAASALPRAESRGSHFRIDFPAEQPELQVHIVHRLGCEPAFEQWN